MPDAFTPIEIAAVVTLADQLRYLEWLLDRPAARRRRLFFQGSAIVLTPLLSVFLGLLTWSFTSGEPIGALLREAPHDPGVLLIMAETAGFMALLTGLNRVLRRRVLRQRLRRLLRERPGIDAKDPDLGEAVWYSFGQGGFECRTTVSTTKLGWPGVKRLADAGTVLVVETGGMSGYIIPKRCLSAGQANLLSSLFQAYADTRTPEL